MKVLEKKKIHDDNLIQYSLTEKRVLSQMDHPFIVKLHCTFQNQKYLFMVLDYHQGGDLGEQLEQREWFTESRAQLYTAEILLALEKLHENNIIFRDLKPENILLDKLGHIVMIDFGLAKANITHRIKGAHSFCGSVAYLAPEMILKKGHG